MKTEKFKVIDFIREIIVLIDKEMDNFPKKDIEIKNRIRTNTYDLLEIAYEANSSIDIKLKQELILKVLAKIKVIDFLLNISYDKKIITSKKYMRIANKLDDIAKYASGWLNRISESIKSNKDK